MNKSKQELKHHLITNLEVNMTTLNSQEQVPVSELERDERVDELQKLLAKAIVQERGYAELSSDVKADVLTVLKSLGSMRFENKESLVRVARSLLVPIAPQLEQYISIALANASRQLAEVKGVLVIYTGGTIGSAPKDPNDPDSPQVVKPWKELKNASPQLSLLGYPVDAISFIDPLDSCNVGPQHWRTMSKIIQKYYNDYTGFVILHGTDSMVYSASALSFMLVDLNKPIVLTGSQVAGIVNPRNDVALSKIL